MRKLAGVVAIILLSLGACVQEPNFSSTPVISFKSIQKITKTSNDGFGGTTKIDSVIMSINFQDAEGDLGLTESQLKSDVKYKDFRNFDVISSTTEEWGLYSYHVHSCTGWFDEFQL